MAQPQTTAGVIKPGHSRMAREAPEHQSKAQANKAAVDAINQARATVEDSIVSILTGGDPGQAIQQAEQAAASVNPTTEGRLAASTDEAPGMVTVPADLVGQRPALDLVFSTDKTGLVRVHKATCRHLPKQTAPLMQLPERVFASYCCKPRVESKRCAWCGEGSGGELGPVVRQAGGDEAHRCCATASTSGALATQVAKGKGADRITTLNAKKAAAKAARDAGHPIPDEQLKSMTAEQADKVAEARRTHKAPAAKAS